MWEILALHKEQESLNSRLELVHNRQEQMVEQETRALEEFDTFTGIEPFLLALISDIDFSLGPEFLGLLVTLSGSSSSIHSVPSKSSSSNDSRP